MLDLRGQYYYIYLYLCSECKVCLFVSLLSEEKTEQLLDCKQELEQTEAEFKRLQQEVWKYEIASQAVVFQSDMFEFIDLIRANMLESSTLE